MKKKETILKELEEFVKTIGFSIRYEKGSFIGGDCRVHEDKILVVNKFLPIEGRIATIARVVNQSTFKESASPKVKTWIEQYV